MWLATKHGFYSVVEKEEGEFHIRARIIGDLENLAALMMKRDIMLPEIQEWPSADYRYRIIVSRVIAVEIITELARGIDYPNFKDKIVTTPDQANKLSAYYHIWKRLWLLQGC